MTLFSGSRGDRGFPRDTLQFMSDYNDFLPGVSLKKFYYGYILDFGIETPILWKSTFNSTNDTTNGVSDQANYTQEIADINFDMEISAERIIRGDCIITIGWGLIAPSGVGDSINGYVVAIVKHYDGTNETILATTKTDIQNATNSGDENYSQTLFLNLIKKHFAAGDILRLTLQGWAQTNDAPDAPEIKINHDGTKYIDVPFARLDEY